jgi:hypothetical protein
MTQPSLGPSHHSWRPQQLQLPLTGLVAQPSVQAISRRAFRLWPSPAAMTRPRSEPVVTFVPGTGVPASALRSASSDLGMRHFSETDMTWLKTLTAAPCAALADLMQPQLHRPDHLLRLRLLTRDAPMERRQTMTALTYLSLANSSCLGSEGLGPACQYSPLCCKAWTHRMTFLR